MMHYLFQEISTSDYINQNETCRTIIRTMSDHLEELDYQLDPR